MLFAFVPHRSNNSPGISNVGFCLRSTRDRHIPSFRVISTLSPPPDAINLIFLFSISACFSRCLFSANATNVIKSSYLIPINIFDCYGYNSILSRGLVIIDIHSYILSVYFATKFLLKIGLLINLSSFLYTSGLTWCWSYSGLRKTEDK